MLLALLAICAPLNFITVTTTEQKFGDFIQNFNKSYQDNPFELTRRLQVFKESLDRIAHLNSHRNHNDSAEYGITEYSDLTPKEFFQKIIKRFPDSWNNPHRISKREVKLGVTNFKNMTGIPQKIDWRDSNIVTSVNNQDKCGACWAFSTVQTIESMFALRSKNLTKLSVQQMVDCSTENNGCDGGDTCGALDWLEKNNIYLTTETKYPFQDGTSGQCKMVPKTGVQVANFTCNNFTGYEEEILKLLANHGPVVAAVDASGWQDYLGGIIQFHCDTNRNHAVQIVGYDLTGDIPYYIVRNSWGTQFGLNGYLNIAIGKNLCAISEEVSSVTIV